MASYNWNHVYRAEDLANYPQGNPLIARTYALLAEGNAVEMGEMWYGGGMNYKLRYMPRVDYDVSITERAGLYVTHDSHGFWVMGKLGSIRSTPFLTVLTAEAYLEKRKAEV